MKVRLRIHELTLITIITVIKMGFYIRNAINLTLEEIGIRYAAPFDAAQIPFDFYINILLPQISQVLILYLCYLAIIHFIIPPIVRLPWRDLSVNFIKNAAWIFIKILLICYLLALGINLITWIAHPHFYNYGLAGFNILAMFGYNDRPLTNLFFGFNRAFNLVLLITALGCLREIVIHYLEKPGANRDYRVLVANQITTLLLLYFSLAPLILFIAEPDLPELKIIYFSFIPVSLLIFFSNTYWLFPLKAEKSIFSLPIIIKWMASNFFAVFIFVIFYAKQDNNLLNVMIYAAVTLCIINPLSWFYYQQRKDKILQLRGVEKQLVKSNTDLQFLRAQINPHFLFNALNTLYGTALLENSERTAEGIQKLGDMMRFMLHQNQEDFIPMRDEITYLQNYIALQKLRIQSSPEFIINEDFDVNQCDFQIAPMLLIPLVENAFKHGISLVKKSWISIKLKCQNDQVYFEVRNSHHHPGKPHLESEKSGIGLKNVKERLNLIYENRFQFNHGVEDDEFFAQLTIKSLN